MTEKNKNKLSDFEKKFAAERKKQGAGGIFEFKGKKYTTNYKNEKVSKKAEEKKKKNKAINSGVSIKDLEPLGESKLLAIGAKKVIGDKKPAVGKVDVGLSKALRDLKIKDKEIFDAKEKAGMPSGSIAVTIATITKVPKKPIFKGFGNLEQQKKRKEWDAMYGKDYKVDGTPKNKRQDRRNKFHKKRHERLNKDMNVGGLTQSSMMNGLNRRINPTTGLTMQKGGMIDYRKKGMFYGGGMARRGK
jgi:hypothetical protein